uniref:Uncharacterized protein n=1 Tax=Ananas comosus var. bracteatus TaxID=296719 RepID=A0A6V7P4H6_ANACO|nr:unnamed protein product [Ananas comosus var. bracteatus]
MLINQNNKTSMYTILYSSCCIDADGLNPSPDIVPFVEIQGVAPQVVAERPPASPRDTGVTVLPTDVVHHGLPPGPCHRLGRRNILSPSPSLLERSLLLRAIFVKQLPVLETDRPEAREIEAMSLRRSELTFIRFSKFFIGHRLMKSSHQ